MGNTTAQLETGAQATKRAEADYRLLASAQQDGIAAAEAAAKRQGEINKTHLDDIQNQIKALQDEAKQQISTATSQEQKLQIANSLQEKLMAKMTEATAIAKEQIGLEEVVLQKKIEALNVELQGAPDNLKVAEIKRTILGLETDLAIKTEERARLDQDAAIKVGDAGKISEEMKIKESEAIQKINDQLVFQTNLYNQLSAAKAAGATPDQLALLKNTLEQTQSLPELISQEQIDRLQQAVTEAEKLKQKN